MLCLSPFWITENGEDSFPVPCGKCPPCLKRRISAWSFRLMQEDKKAMTSYFVTLTYGTKHVPLTEKGYMSLHKKHVQAYWKSIRKKMFKHGRGNLRYFVAGEYGGRTDRPHYHAIVFNADVRYLVNCWEYGHVHIGAVTGASVGYTLKYMCKPGRIPMHQNDDRVPEFQCMSKGLGASYLTPAMVKYHHADMFKRMLITIEDGKKIAMPRYFKDKLYTKEQREEIGMRMAMERIEQTEKAMTEFMKKYPNDWQRLLQESRDYQYKQFFKNANKNRNHV